MHRLPNVFLATCLAAFIVVTTITILPSPWNPRPLTPLTIILMAQAACTIGLLGFHALRNTVPKN